MNPFAVPKLSSKHGAEIPAVGFGTSQLGDCGEIVSNALKLGYRHIDTAWKYGSERGVGEGMRTTTGALVVTSQLYTFGDTPGEAMLSSDGFELVDVGMEVSRAITGGTGSFAGAGGEARQVLLGLNASEGVNLRYELELKSAAS